jgi:vancomycin resistance protein VanJ
MKWLRGVAVTAAVLYPLALAATTAALRYIGERWWVTTVALYLPRLAFAAPLPFLVAALVACSATRWLWLESISAILLLFPLMGLVVPAPRAFDSGAPKLRILSYNVNSTFGGADRLAQEVERFSPDLVLMQEIGVPDELKRVFGASYATVDSSGQFFVASRLPIVSKVDPERLTFGQGGAASAGYRAYVVESPFGRVRVFNVHPISPREDFHALRGRGLRREILSGRFFSGTAAPAVLANAKVREAQVEAFARATAESAEPVVIGGDTNLPGLSLIFSRYLSGFRDGFVEAGSGFGYTYPNDRRPWMRIDRILTTSDLRVTRFQIGASGASDHLCVVADVELGR